MHIVNDNDKSKVKTYIFEALKAMDRIAEERANITDILNTLKEQHDLTPKLSRKILSALKQGNMPEIREENEDFEELCAIVN